MTADELKAWCLEMPLAEETFPFNPETFVFKVAGKSSRFRDSGRSP